MELRDMQVSAEDVRRRLDFVGYAPEDARRVMTLRPLVERDLSRFVDTFFDHLAGLPEAKSLLENTATVEQARRLKAEHLRAMVSGHYDADYAEQRIKLGRLYSRAGLDVRVFLGAFHVLMRRIGEAVMEERHNDSREAFADFMAFKKIAFFDLGIIVDVLLFERERTIRQQQEAIRELSTPVLQLRDRLLILPIIGIIDTLRARLLTESLLRAVRDNRAKVVVMDVTGVAAVDTKVANHLLQTVAAAKLMGASVIVTGLSAEVSQTLVALGVNLGGLNTVGDLQGGIEDAERLLGYQVVSSLVPASATPATASAPATNGHGA